MEMHGFLRSRRSIRRFQNKDVDFVTLNRILETTLYAPSAHNGQPWRLAIVSTPDTKKRLGDEMGIHFRDDLTREGLPSDEIEKRIERSKYRINSAPVVITICLDETDMDEYSDLRRQQAETTMGVQSVAMAGLQLLLAAHAEGLGGVWTCGPLFAPEAVRKALSLPKTWLPQGMLLIGYPNEVPTEKEIKSTLELVKYVE
jgi:coenzyme F420-0:L-glutamate ligase / coenzyme F420-1:gamma-L-glutamate ligase